jgi:hypothetical protein
MRKKVVRTSIVLLLAMFAALSGQAQSPQIIPVNGSTSANIGTTKTYSVTGNYGCLNWFVTNGTIQGSSTGNSITVLWSATPATGYVNVMHFPSCTPNMAPTVVGYTSVSITNPPPPSGCSGYANGTCGWFQCQIDAAYNGSGGNCAAVTATYNGILQGYPSLSSCSINKHGCP